MTDNNQTIYLKNYQAPDFFIEKTELTFDLSKPLTTVTSRLYIKRNGEHQNALVLDGEQLTLLSVTIDGKKLSEKDYQINDTSLSLPTLAKQFVLEIDVEIDPDNNTALEGLYRSSNMYCTQCEAEGFRKITYYLDRPDVMSVFTTTIIADGKINPVMLSNGNCISDEVLENGLRQVVWHDPHKKPSYLFALVAGNLEAVTDTFTTESGREVKLYIYVESKDLNKCDHAMDSLKRAMRWDEQQYGREYDLDIFMVVAVDDFNMGAMENKGLNIFNTSCVLAHPETTSDAGFQRVEAVVAHEYFHNWSGNRVTCRDWFQLSLKEGFTVYRDAEFSADMNSRAVKRIEDVNILRAHQFVEDQGPLAHPVQPKSFIEISNFYTLTIYEKGQEVVRMIANILGPKLFRKGSDLYFERHDGQAVTCEDFVKAMEDASGIDLTQFRLWYDYAGTPELSIKGDYDASLKQFSLTVHQSVPDTPGQTDKKPMHIPLKMALLTESGEQPLVSKALSLEGVYETVLDITEREQCFVFENIESKPVPSLLRGFSAPVKLLYDYSAVEQALLMQNDSDGFVRFDASEKLAVQLLNSLIAGDAEKAKQLEQVYVEALEGIFEQDMDNALKAFLLSLPSLNYLISLQQAANPKAIAGVYYALQQRLAVKFAGKWQQLFDALSARTKGMAGQAIAARSLQALALQNIVLADAQKQTIAENHYQSALVMSDRLAALKALLITGETNARLQTLLEDFYQRFSDEPLVVNLWFQLQVSRRGEQSLEVAKTLMAHPAFDANNPNKLRALLGGLCQNVEAFHCDTGAGYQFLAEQILQLDGKNPQLAARLIAPLTRWQQLDGHYQGLMKKALQFIKQRGELSKDLFEVLQKSLPEQ